MKALIINTAAIQNLKLIAETESDIAYLKILNDAGTLSLTASSTGNSAIFTPVTVVEEDFSGNTANASNSIGRFNFDLRQNENKIFDFNFSTSDGPIDLTSYDAIKLQVKSPGSGSAIISLSLGYGLEIIGEENNKLRITFSAEQTQQLYFPTYSYDILFQWGDSKSYNVEGIINVLKSVTRG